MRTKQKIADTLKQLMQKKELSRITVTDIVTTCDINRKTFYYHFQDINDLMKWILEQDTVEVMRSFDLLVNPEEAIGFVIDYVHDNSYMIRSVYDVMGRDQMKRFFQNDFHAVLRSVILDVAEQMNMECDEQLLSFLTDFYTEALAGTLIDYFQGKTKRSRQEIIDDTILVLKESIPHILSHAQ